MTRNDTQPAAAHPADEIDLTGLFVGIVRFFIRNRMWLVLATLAGIGAGYGFFHLKKPVYRSRLTAECMSLPDARTVELILDLEKVRQNEDWDQLAAALGITPGEARLVKKIEPFSSVSIDKVAKGVDDYLLPTQDVSYVFSVEIRVKERNDLWKKIQAGLLRHLAANGYSKTRVDRFLENRRNLAASITREIHKLDSLNMLYAGKVIGSQTSSTLTSPGDYKTLVINLIERKLAVEDELRFAEPVRIIQPFTIFRNPVEPVLSQSVLAFTAGSWALVLFLILIRHLSGVYKENEIRYRS